jgi:diacylglycerol kinase family enzyme
VLRGRGEQQVPLGFLPLGTSNDYARVLGVADDRAALAALIGGRLRRVDLVECQYHGPDGAPRRDLFCSSAGLGFTGAVTQADRPGGALTYLKRWLGTGGFMVAGAAIALTFRGARARIELDGVKRELPAAVLEVSKMPWVTGRRLTPSSRPDDGKLDLVAFDGSLLRRARLLLSVLGEGRHVAWPDFHYLRGFDEVMVETERPLPLHIHGDWVGTGPARFRVLPGALTVLVP